MTTPTTESAASISPIQLMALRADDPSMRILDVRTPGEFHSAHIPGAYNVPLDQMSEHRGELARLHHPIVLVCQSGARATTAMEQLQDAGKVDLRLLVGGMNAWQQAGGDMAVAAEQRWSLERQVRLVAGLIVLVSILVSLAVPAARFVAGFVGAGLTFAAVTDTCAMGMLLAKLPYNRGPGCDVDSVVRQLASA